MPGVEFSHIGFEVPEEVAEILEGIKDPKLKNVILSTCGIGFQEAYRQAERCNILDALNALVFSGNALSRAQTFANAVVSKEKAIENDEVFAILGTTFTQSITNIFIKSCECQSRGAKMSPAEHQKRIDAFLEKGRVSDAVAERERFYRERG